MGANPITALSKQFQNLINEHGSATILKERVSLFKEHVTDLEKKNSELEAKILKLEADNRELKDQSEEQNQIINELKKLTDPHDTIEEIKINILICISEESKTDEEISLSISSGKEVVKYHLEELLDTNIKTRRHPSGFLKSGWVS